MKISIGLIVIGAFICMMSGCVENSQKYKSLQTSLDSLNVQHSMQGQEMEKLFAGINEVSEGLESLRQAEQLLSINADTKQENGNTSQFERMKNDIQLISASINEYKSKIAQLEQLENNNKTQSAEFKKLIANLNKELDQRRLRIEEITRQLEHKDSQIRQQTQQIEKLNVNVQNLNEKTENQIEVIQQQDKKLHTAFYLVGTRKELKEAEVINRHGIFASPVVSAQAQSANFKGIDIRENKTINLESKKAKVLSTHPENSYELIKDAEGMLTLKITDEENFWQQTKYLVIMKG